VHLRTIRDRLLRLNPQRTEQLLEMYQQILQHGSILTNDEPDQMTLWLSGIVTRQGDRLHVSNRIYETVFNIDWVEQELTRLHPPTQPLTKTKILILPGNPKNTNRLRLDEEIREIRSAIERTGRQHQFEIVTVWATRMQDLRRSLLDHKPQIVHFSGNSGEVNGLALENSAGRVKLVSEVVLGQLFKLFKHVECVFLNACYLEVQAEAISQHIPYVVGINVEGEGIDQGIGDYAAIEFAKGFYDALGAGRSVEDAFKIGRVSIAFESIPESVAPVLKIRNNSADTSSSLQSVLDEAPPQPATSSVTDENQEGHLPLLKILLLSAAPTRTITLHLDEEMRGIKAELQRSRHRDQFVLEYGMAARPRDVQRALIVHKPQIVHFCGHGTGAEGLVLADESGQIKAISTVALTTLFELFANQVECVLLNGCYSEVQADAIAHHIPYVIGMNQPIGDSAAIEFATSFYDALGEGESVDFAFRLGCNSMQLQEIPEHLTPVLKSRKSPAAIASTHRPMLNNVPSPLPASIIYENPEGQVPLDSMFYIDRPPIESDCYAEIVKPGSLIRIQAPRQMGKTSLLSRILHHASEQSYQTVHLDFQAIDTKVLSSLDKFLQWCCNSIADQLNLPNKLEEHWKEPLGATDNCTDYFRRYLLAETDQPIALGLDGVEEVIRHTEIAQDFLALLRSWHERAKLDLLWKKLRLVVVSSTELYIPLNINQSPFNVGFAIALPTFTQEQVQSLVQRHGLSWKPNEISQLMRLLGGHPYLVRIALYQIARSRMTIETLMHEAATNEGLYRDHLRRLLLNLEHDEELLQAMKQVLATDKPVKLSSSITFKLRNLGLVSLQGKGSSVLPSCGLYRQYFRNRL
jgi:hypothetical protein